MRKRRSAAATKTRRQPLPRQPPTSPEAALITRRQRGGDWVTLPEAARRLGFDWRTLRRHIAAQPFVRVLGPRWYVRYPDFAEWWERQRPPSTAAASSR